MTDFMQIFSGNPMTTLVGRKIEQATDPLLESDDWGLNLEICDIINETDDGARDAIRAIKKRLILDTSKNFNVIYRTLTVLEACVNNCNLRFHILCMSKDFIQELVKLIGPKNDPPIELQERVLSLIERWADAFDTQPELQGVVKVYHELKAKGITFPPQNLDTLAPIQTPRRILSSSPTNRDQPSVAVLNSSNSSGDSPTFNSGGSFSDNMSQQQQQQQQQQQAGRVVSPQSQQQPDGPVLLDSEGHKKISQDLNVVQSSVNVFNEILDQLTTKNDPEDWNLLEELNTTCRQMKVRIVDLIEWVANENLTIELLRLNDELNNVFVKYERLLKKQQSSIKAPESRETTTNLPATSSSVVGALGATSGTSTITSIPKQPTELSLIDFKDEDGGNTTAGGSNPDRGEKSSGDTVKMEQLVKETSRPDITPSTTSAGVGKETSSKTYRASDDPDFDVFAQSRSNIYNDRKAPTNYDPVEETATNLNRMSLNKNKNVAPVTAVTAGSSRLPEEISSVREQDFEEIEKWLATDSNNQLTASDPISIPNSEFENFLATRALAGDKQQTK